MAAVVPMESSPEVFNHVAHLLGLDNAHAFVDVYSLDDPDLLAMVPRPVSAIVLLFPLTEGLREPIASGDAGKSRDNGSDNGSEAGNGSGVSWFRQSIKNACGLYAVLHALSNNKEILEPTSVLGNFLESHSAMRFDDEQTNKFVLDAADKYRETFTMGSTSYPQDVDPSQIEVNLHFVTYVVQNGHVYELDGRRAGPLDLGTADDSASDILAQPLLKSRIQELMSAAQNSQDSLNFSILGLTEAWD